MFVHDFVAVWNKVMNLDRFDLSSSDLNVIRDVNTADLGLLVSAN